MYTILDNLINYCPPRKFNTGDENIVNPDVELVEGSGATAHLESGGFIRSRAGVSHPDIQIHFVPTQVTQCDAIRSEQFLWRCSLTQL